MPAEGQAGGGVPGAARLCGEGAGRSFRQNGLRFLPSFRTRPPGEGSTEARGQTGPKLDKAARTLKPRCVLRTARFHAAVPALSAPGCRNVCFTPSEAGPAGSC